MSGSTDFLKNSVKKIYTESKLIFIAILICILILAGIGFYLVFQNINENSEQKITIIDKQQLEKLKISPKTPLLEDFTDVLNAGRDFPKEQMPSERQNNFLAAVDVTIATPRSGTRQIRSALVQTISQYSLKPKQEMKAKTRRENIFKSEPCQDIGDECVIFTDIVNDNEEKSNIYILRFYKKNFMIEYELASREKNLDLLRSIAKEQSNLI
jgi:hypothetical protein